MDRTPSDTHGSSEVSVIKAPQIPHLFLFFFPFFSIATMFSLVMNSHTPSYREPRWVWHFGNRRGYLTHALTVFAGAISKKYERDHEFKYFMDKFGIKLSCFSYLQGPADPTVTQWFMPDRKVQFHPKVDVKARRNSFFTMHDKLRSSTKSERKKDEKLGRALSTELNEFSLTAQSKQRFKPVE